jgi:hypothetical protein
MFIMCVLGDCVCVLIHLSHTLAQTHATSRIAEHDQCDVAARSGHGCYHFTARRQQRCQARCCDSSSSCIDTRTQYERQCATSTHVSDVIAESELVARPHAAARTRRVIARCAWRCVCCYYYSYVKHSITTHTDFTHNSNSVIYGNNDDALIVVSSCDGQSICAQTHAVAAHSYQIAC